MLVGRTRALGLAPREHLDVVRAPVTVGTAEHFRGIVGDEAVGPQRRPVAPQEMDHVGLALRLHPVGGHHSDGGGHGDDPIPSPLLAELPPRSYHRGVARHGTLVGHDDRRLDDRGLDDSDLVVVELDEAPPLWVRTDREAFEEQFAQLAFGLGTVRRRVHADRASRAPMWVLLLAVVVAMLAVLIGNPGQSTTAASGGDALRVLDAPTGARVVIVAEDRIESIDVDRRAERVTRLAGIPDGTATAAVSAGDTLAVVVRGRAWGVDRALDRPAVDLGPADVVFRSGAEGWVWVAVATSSGWDLRMVSTVSGAQGAAFLTDTASGTGRPLGVVQPDGLVLDRIEDGRRVVGSSERSRPVPRHDVVLGLADTSVAALDCAGRTCAIVLTDLHSGRQHRIGTPLPGDWSIGPSAVGLGGGAIAALVNAPGSDSSRVLVTRDGVARLVDVGGHATTLAWSADWLFVMVDDGRLVAIGPAGGARTVDLPSLPSGALIGG